MWLIDILFAPPREEIERAENYLLSTFGDGAAREANRLAQVCGRIGSRSNARVYRRVAKRLSRLPATAPQGSAAHG